MTLRANNPRKIWRQALVSVGLVALVFVLTIAAVVSFSWRDLSRGEHVLYERSGEAGPVRKVRVAGLGQFDYQRLMEAVSEPGESMDAFAHRIGPRLRAYSDETGFEACGVIATDGERFGVVLGSNHSHIACVNVHAFVPDGMRDTGETIHSHGNTERFNANRNDLTLQGQHFAGQMGIRSVAGQRLDAFSRMDYEGGPGYLATPTGVIHQKGRGSVRHVHPHNAH